MQFLVDNDQCEVNIKQILPEGGGGRGGETMGNS